MGFLSWKGISFAGCLLVSFTSTDANPLAKFLMMTRKDPQAGAPVSPPFPAPTPDSTAPVQGCIPTRTLEEVQDQLSEVSAAKTTAEQQKAEANSIVAKLQAEHEEFQKETESRLETLSKANESANKVARVQEEFAARIAKMQQQASKELEAAKATIAEKEKELALLKEENDQKIASVEEKWKNGVKTVESDKTEVVIQIQTEYEERLKEVEEQKSVLVAEKNVLQENYDKLDGKYENLMKNREIALQAFLEVNLQQEAAKISVSFRESLENELEELKASSESTIAELTRELESLKESSAATIKKWEQDYGELKESTSKTIAKLTADYAELQQSNNKFIDEMKKSHQSALNELKQQKATEWESSVEGLSVEHDEAMATLKQQIESFEKDNGALIHAIQTANKELGETKETCKRAMDDADYWEEKFVSRSYVNFTQIAEGSGALPAYDSYVAPRVNKAKSVVSNSVQTTLKGMKQQYEKKCPIALATLRAVENSTGFVLPQSLFDKTQYSCRHGEESVSFLLKAILFVLLVLLRHPLWTTSEPVRDMIVRATHITIVDPLNRLRGKDVPLRALNGGYLSGTGGTPPKKPAQIQVS